ncbi:MAG: response regulator with CheY-like receiver domain and winged-helix DNA-binding domain [Verrucomicrobiales bacterium]|nr:response regulator with CheY-like receiver domain and winged-helix DNA-binding domain [Verrucomicrobiales bacterium]
MDPSLELVLIAEDDEADAILLQRAMHKITDPVPIHMVRNGEEAISYLMGDGAYSDRNRFPFPTAVLLDLKMPRKNGFEVLEWMRSSPQYAVVPTIVWSSSSLPQDVRRAYDLGANCYLMKPNSHSEIEQLVELTVSFWRVCLRPAPVPKADLSEPALH